MPPLTYRACCSSPSPGGVYYTDPTELPKGGGPEIPIDLPADFSPSLDVAMHEAGHAAILHLLGVHIVRAKVGLRSFVERDVADAISGREMILLAQAGDVAARWAHRHVFQPFDADYLESVERVRSGCFGSCDDCQAAVFATLDPDASDDAGTIGVMRTVERQAVDLITSPSVSTAVRALAGRLMADGTVDGATAHEILSQFITFGSLRTTEASHPIAKIERANPCSKASANF